MAIDGEYLSRPSFVGREASASGIPLPAHEIITVSAGRLATSARSSEDARAGRRSSPSIVETSPCVQPESTPSASRLRRQRGPVILWLSRGQRVTLYSPHMAQGRRFVKGTAKALCG